tara:strand:+ start:491 stop:1240 length:750 start_codon:yes stop_codon:yes gene_type:complete
MKKSLIILLFIPFFLNAQKKITGTVVDINNKPLTGVKVIIEDNQGETLTESNGAFSLITNGDGNLLFSKVGFSGQSIPFNSSTYALNITMNEVKNIIDKDKKTNSLRNIKIISGRDLIEVIAGRIAGAKIQSGYGGNKNITLRGRQSFSTGSDGVIWDINGMIYNSPPPLDISQIRYLEVLKDMASTNRYGSQGGAGVIILKTEVTKAEYQSSKNLWNAPPPLTKEERKALKAERKAKRKEKKEKKKNS